jgi:hypothetical protein
MAAWTNMDCAALTGCKFVPTTQHRSVQISQREQYHQTTQTEETV